MARISRLGLAGLAVGLVAALAVPAGSSAAGADALVGTANGTVQGTVSATERTFLGIPYATPPTGALRFAAPQPAKPWSGVLQATKGGPACAQSLPEVGTLLPSSEDCLRLNVFTPPAARSHDLPVMVWIYGGAYLAGADDYDPTPLVTGGNVIVVTVNYRVGPFGFLALPGADTNNGLRDQQAGLRWVHDNIAAFGGNASNVTIFGESAGGNSVCQQVASPLAAGLFQHAISESGACSGSPLADGTPAEARATSEGYARELGCTDAATMLACLRALPTAKLLSSASVQFTSMDAPWKPSVDGDVEPESLDQAWATGHFNHVPMIVGNNHDEGRLFVAVQDHLPHLFPVTTANYTAFLQHFYGSQAGSIATLYPPAWYGLADKQKAQVITDGFFACPAVRTTAGVASGGSPVYEYEFADPDPPLSGLDPIMPMGDYHASELWYLFSDVNGIPRVPLTAGQQALSAQMVAAWTTFARTGVPAGAAWPSWSASHPVAMTLTHTGSRLTTDVAAEHECGFWSKISP
jgi:para-nitrobenzyl esterase